MLGTMGATKHRSARFVSVADDAATAMGTPRSERVDGAFETIEIVGNAIGHDFQWFVVLVAAHFARLQSGMERCLRLIGQFRL